MWQSLRRTCARNINTARRTHHARRDKPAGPPASRSGALSWRSSAGPAARHRAPPANPSSAACSGERRRGRLSRAGNRDCRRDSTGRCGPRRSARPAPWQSRRSVPPSLATAGLSLSLGHAKESRRTPAREGERVPPRGMARRKTQTYGSASVAECGGRLTARQSRRLRQRAPLFIVRCAIGLWPS